MSKLIGIVPAANMYETLNSREDLYRTGNNYIKRITECGGIPLGILPVDGWITEEYLERFDAFLITGGNKTWPYHIAVIDHVLRTGKPLLGICLGMQSIHRYMRTRDYMNETGYSGSICDCYNALYEQDNHYALEPIPGHNLCLEIGHEEEAKHAVKVLPGTMLHRLTGKDEIKAGSFHNFRIKDPSPCVTVSGVAPDGTIEAIEYGDNILGVQFHPEIQQDFMPFFEMICT